MDIVKALEIFDLAWQSYEKIATRGYILCGIGGFVIGMAVAMLVFMHEPKKRNK